MLRFSSLSTVPAETRRILRDRLERHLPSRHATPAHGPKQVMLGDEAMLCLLQNLEINCGRDVVNARAAYDNARLQAANEPDFDELFATGWLSAEWGRVSTTTRVRQGVRTAPDGSMTALKALLPSLYECTYKLNDTARSNADLAAISGAIERGEQALHNVGSQSPEWVVARLWDRGLAAEENSTAALRTWVDRWTILDCPSLLPVHAWDEGAAERFGEAVQTLLQSEPGLVNWSSLRENYVKSFELTSDQPAIDFESYIPGIPPTLVDRALWLRDHRIERLVWDTMEACEDILGPVRLLLAEIEAAEYGPAPHRTAERLFTLAAERPALLNSLLLTVIWKPVLLADMLLHAPTSALACLVIAQSHSSGGAWDRELTSRDDAASKEIAFADAVSVMGHFLRQGTIRPDEAAALLVWLHSSAQPGFVDDPGSRENLLTTLSAELMAQSVETLRAMVTDMANQPARSGLGTPVFAAILDLVDIGKLAADIEPDAIIDAYYRSIAAGEYNLSAHRVGARAAATLFEMTARYPELRQHFLYPIDVRAHLANSAEPNPFTLADTIARSIRAHIRIVCRAIAGLNETLPDELVDALIAMVRAGAVTHKEKGRIAAFSPRYEQTPFGPPLDRPIAADLGAALNTLPDQSAKRLLGAVLETDEPLILAQLLSFAPYAMRGAIEERIADIPPSDSGEVYSLTEVQARIDELLSAGAATAAEKFIVVERDLQTMGKAPGRDLARLRAVLRLHLLRGEWDSISNATPPPDLSRQEQDTAWDIIRIFAALAQLKKPDGDWEGARQLFERLYMQRRDIVGLAVNLFAARISILLRGNLFQQLQGQAAHQARLALDDANQATQDPRALNTADRAGLACNKALVFLALGQPTQALQTLAPLRAVPLQDTIAAYNAIALSRMGRGTEAAAILDAAERAYGTTAVLHAARENTATGTPFAASATVMADDNPVARVRIAWLDLLQMDPIQQTEVLHPAPEQFDGWVIKHVRAATASVVSLVPMMSNIAFEAEDDLTALIRELLLGRFEFLGWAVPDQSKGGIAAKENPGERDLVLQKDAATLAVIEAVVSNRPATHEWTKKELASHFQKVLAYSTCRLFFHLTYAYEEIGPILRLLETTCEQGAPPGFTFVRREPIPFTDSRPQGLIARYRSDAGEVKVVFLVLDLNQDRLLQAAKKAQLTNPRTRAGQVDKTAPS
jgi:hypothetical protein